MVSSYKFIQKLWVLNNKIINEINKDYEKDNSNRLEIFTNKYIKKITQNLENFSYNIMVANLHEMHTFLFKEINQKYSKENLRKNYIKILVTLIPILPHFANECISQIKNIGENRWPSYDEKLIEDDEINFVIQVNGKKRGIIKAKKGTNEEILFNKIYKEKNISKYFENKEIRKKIYVKDKLINIII